MLKTALLLLAVCELVSSFLMPSVFMRPTRKFGIISGFESKEFEELVKPIGNAVTVSAPRIDPAAYNEYNISAVAKAANVSEGDVEKVFRKYPFEDCGLPLLQDHDNYYSGSFKDMFWHQNADNFFVFVPIGDDIERKDIHVQFEALSVCVKIRGEIVAQFPCEQRLIPAGSFWLFDKDAKGQRYLHLDIEKRYRMINWNKLFGEPGTVLDSERLAAKSKMLQQMNEANEGLAKLSNMDTETMRDLMSNVELNRMMEGADDEIPPPMVTLTDEHGQQRQVTPEEAGVEWDPATDGVVDLKLHEELKRRIESGEVVDLDGGGSSGGEGETEGSGESSGSTDELVGGESAEEGNSGEASTDRNIMDHSSGGGSVNEGDAYGKEMESSFNSAWSGAGSETGSSDASSDAAMSGDIMSAEAVSSSIDEGEA